MSELRAAPFDAEALRGVSFFDVGAKRKVRYIYPDAGHWTSGWLVIQNPSREWMTWRKATDDDIRRLNAAVVGAHHGEPESDMEQARR